MKKLYVDTEACIGCGACVAMDSEEHFTFDHQGFSVVKSEEHIDEEKIASIIASCPTEAIHYDEVSNEDDHVLEEKEAA